MASSVPSFPSIIVKPSPKHSGCRCVKLKAQNSRDEGDSRSNNMVDTNLSVLSKRMDEVRIKKRLEKCFAVVEYGWNYAPGYDYKMKRDAELSYSLQLLSLAGGSFGLAFLGGTLLLCFLSAVLHLTPGN